MSFDFPLTNHSPEVKELQFGSGQQFELVVRDEKGKEVYRYSDGKFFTMAKNSRNMFTQQKGSDSLLTPMSIARMIWFFPGMK